MFPWPVWNIILNYANCWTLRLVNSRFKNFIEKSYNFKFCDFTPIVERGTLRILKMYHKQHDYICYNVAYNKLKLENREIIEYLARKGHKVSGAAIHAIKSNNLEMFTYYASRFEIYLHSIIKDAFKFNRFTHFFELEGQDQDFLKSAALRGACSGGHYNELVNQFDGNNWAALEKAFKNGNPLLCDKLISMCDPPRPFRGKNEQIFSAAVSAGNIEIAEKYLKEIDHSFIHFALAKACQNGKLDLIKHFIKHMPADPVPICTLFEYAGRSKNIEIVKFLLNFYNLNDKCKEHVTTIVLCFYNACELNRFNIVKYFIEINHPCITLKVIQGAFELACQYTNIEIVKYLHPYVSLISDSLIEKLCMGSCYIVLDYLKTLVLECPRCKTFNYRFKCPINKKNPL